MPSRGELKKYNYEILLIAFIALAFFTPLIAFTYIVFSDQDISLFQKLLSLDFNHNLIMSNYLSDNVPLLKGITLAGVIFFLLGVFSLLSKIIVNQKMTHAPKLYRPMIIGSSITTGTFYVIAFILLGIAQADFSYFNRWVTSLHSNENITTVVYNMPSLKPKMTIINLLEKIWKNHNGGGGPTYNWISSIWVWLLSSLLLAIQLFMLLKITFTILYGKESWFLKRIRFWNTKNPKKQAWLSFWRIQSTRNLAYYFLFGNICLLIIFIIYYVFLVDGGSLSRFIDFFTIKRTLFPFSQSSGGTFHGIYNMYDNNLYLKWITIKEISIFFVFLQILLSFFFFYTNITRSEINLRTYYIWFSLWSFLELATLVIFTYTALEINSLLNYWNANKQKLPGFHFDTKAFHISDRKIVAITLILVTYVIVKLAVILRLLQKLVIISPKKTDVKPQTASLTSKIF